MRGLREQTHEHANHLHAIRGLLALGAPEEALQFLERLETAHHVAYGSISGAIEQHVVAGLLLAETAVAQQRGIVLEVDEASRLTELPARLTDADAVTIVGNLLENAFDAVARLPVERRRVRLTIVDDGELAGHPGRGPRPGRAGGSAAAWRLDQGRACRGRAHPGAGGGRRGRWDAASRAAARSPSRSRAMAEWRTLIVEDAPAVADVHRRLVARVPGFVIVGSAATATEARRQVALTRPHLMLLDLGLPGRERTGAAARAAARA